ncbi:hypothetical protein [Microbacterium sp. AR7-10]|uniref:hypothetical protein n=1 Tax=Microbacterium sp. AR7-10 TaxID=1891970 RepID=UPI0008FCA60E|nr:hypothetical protein [Microbacterium sp. AR7-10]
MPENQAPEIPSRPLAAPPGLRMVGTDAVGVCADRHCTLPTASTSTDGAPGAQDTVDAEASGSDAD